MTKVYLLESLDNDSELTDDKVIGIFSSVDNCIECLRLNEEDLTEDDLDYLSTNYNLEIEISSTMYRTFYITEFEVNKSTRLTWKELKSN